MNIIKRIKSPTPFYWKRISQIATSLAAVATTLITANINDVVTNISSYILVVGVVVAAIARTAKTQD